MNNGLSVAISFRCSSTLVNLKATKLEFLSTDDIQEIIFIFEILRNSFRSERIWCSKALKLDEQSILLKSFII